MNTKIDIAQDNAASKPNSVAGADSSPLPGSAFVVEVGFVDPQWRTTGWREVARYNDSRVAESCMELNRHCEIRIREIEECEACYAARLGVSLDAECECKPNQLRSSKS